MQSERESERQTRPSLRVRAANSAERIAVRVMVPRFSPGALETKILSSLDGVRTVGLVAQRVGLAANEALSLLEKLERMGAVRFVDVVELGADDVDEDPDRPTTPNLAFDRPTLTG